MSAVGIAQNDGRKNITHFGEWTTDGGDQRVPTSVTRSDAGGAGKIREDGNHPEQRPKSQQSEELSK